jgi:hypothetical protein
MAQASNVEGSRGKLSIRAATLRETIERGSSMDVAEVLKKAWSAVEDAGLPEHVQPTGFREAVRLLAPGDSVGARPSRSAVVSRDTGDSGSTSGSSGDEQISVSENVIYERVVEHTGADREKLEQVLHLDDEGVHVSLPGLRLGRTNAERTRAVAQILTIARGFGLGENETSLEVIRSECTRLKVYDSANFSAHVGKLAGYVMSGSGQNRRLRAKSPGIQAFPALVDALVSDS